MTPRRIDVILDDVLTAIAEAEAVMRGQDLDGFRRSCFQQPGVERIVEIVSEAARHLPQELLDAHPEPPRRAIRAVGDAIRHEYHRVDPEEIWMIVERDFPPLKQAIAAMRAGLRD